MANVRKRRNAQQKSAVGQDIPPQKVVLRGMADLEKTLARHFQETENQRARLAEANTPLRDKLLGIIGKDPAWAASVRRGRHVRQKSMASRRISRTIKLPDADAFIALNGGTRVRPFDYAWTWSAKAGGSPTDILEVKADTKWGELEINLEAGSGKKAANFSARAALGIFFRLPLWPLASFTFRASPIFNFNWQTYCGLSSVHTDGFIGLFAASYDWAGNFSAVLTDQKLSLWSDDSWWDGGSGVDNSHGFPMSANFLVDSDHWYALWVWCGSHNIGDGWYTIRYSDAVSELFVLVNSISWQFDPLQPRIVASP